MYMYIRFIKFMGQGKESNASGGLIKRIVESTEEVTRTRNIDNVRHNKKTTKDKTELKGEESDTKENSLTKKKIKRP